MVADLLACYAAEHLRRNGLRAAGSAEKQLRLHVLPTWSATLVFDLRGDPVRLIEAVRIPRATAARRRTDAAPHSTPPRDISTR